MPEINSLSLSYNLWATLTSPNKVIVNCKPDRLFLPWNNQDQIHRTNHSNFQALYKPVDSVSMSLHVQFMFLIVLERKPREKTKETQIFILLTSLSSFSKSEEPTVFLLLFIAEILFIRTSTISICIIQVQTTLPFNTSTFLLVIREVFLRS